MPNDALHVLVVEDDPTTRELLLAILEARGHRVSACGSAEEAWEVHRESNPPLVLLDWMLPGMDGLALCRQIRAAGAAPCVILLLTARNEPDDLRAVLDAGADDYVAKPLDARLLEIRVAIAERRVADLQERHKAEESVRALRKLLEDQEHLGHLIGHSPAMWAVCDRIRDLARVDSTVLIEGETGTGKELVARAIHDGSRRAGKAFVAVNCAGLTESLLASQLFGHRRGAFTGAIDDHKGFFETASGGTLLLDEVGDIPPSVQVSLLRVLQEREILRVGDSTPRKIDVRVLAATHRDLNAEVARGALRADFLYRIRVARVRLPALRERREDLPLLIESFLGEFRNTMGIACESLSRDALRALMRYGWPGNVRELRSAIEYAVIGCKGKQMQAADLPPEVLLAPAAAVTLPPSEDEERERIAAALKSARGQRSTAARLLGISRATLYRRMRELGLGEQQGA